MRSKNKFQLFIQTNSPGELSSWVTSICKTCEEAYPNTEITIFLTPCQYATGQEKQRAEALPLVKKTYGPKETIKHLFSWPIRKKLDSKGAVLFLGGDPMYSRLLGLKYGLPIYGYSEKSYQLGYMFKKTFLAKEIGNLMADSITKHPTSKAEILKRLNLPDLEYHLFFTGSRPKQFGPYFPIICNTIHYLKTVVPNFNPIINISSFITDEQLNKAKASTNTEGILFFREPSLEMMRISKWLITIPGTNNAEAAYLRLPMIIIIPLNYPELLIFDGILGLLSYIPLLGAKILEGIVAILKTRKGFYALPNRMTQKHIVPELIDTFTPEQLGDALSVYLNSPEKWAEIKDNLSVIPIPENISKKILKDIINPLYETPNTPHKSN